MTYQYIFLKCDCQNFTINTTMLNANVSIICNRIRRNYHPKINSEYYCAKLGQTRVLSFQVIYLRASKLFLGLLFLSTIETVLSNSHNNDKSDTRPSTSSSINSKAIVHEKLFDTTLNHLIVDRNTGIVSIQSSFMFSRQRKMQNINLSPLFNHD